MKGMMRKMALLALVPVASVAASWCDCGDWSVGADLLVWSHTDCDYNYATLALDVANTGLETTATDAFFQDGSFYTVAPQNTSRLQNNHEEYVRLSYSPGVRLHGRFENCHRYVEASYLWIELKDSRTTDSVFTRLGSGGNLSGAPPEGPPGTTQTLQSDVFPANPSNIRTSGSLRSRYQNVNIEAGRAIMAGCRGVASFYGNFRWVDIDHTRSTTALIPFSGGPVPFQGDPYPGGPEFTFRWKSQFSGAGLGFGLSGDFDLCCGLHAIGHMGVMGLIGETRMRATGMTVAGFFGAAFDENLRVPSRTCFVPGLDVCVGLGYERACQCVALAVELVYDLHYYPHALSWRGGSTEPGGAGHQNVVGNIGYGGPVLRFRVGY